MKEQCSCKSKGTGEIHTSAWVTLMLMSESEDQRHLPKGGHKIILDIPVLLPQFPKTLATGQVTH